jgi:hypothetical protein
MIADAAVRLPEHLQEWVQTSTDTIMEADGRNGAE